MKIDNSNYKQFSFFILILMGISVFFSYEISVFIQTYTIPIPFYIETPFSTPAIFFILFFLFDKYFWKYKVFQIIGIIVSDDLNGKWSGTLKSSHDKFSKEIPATLVIKQTATQIKIFGTFNESKSVSVHENFGKSEIDGNIALFYFFRNEPGYDAVDTMAMHEGAAKLIHDKNTDSLSGYYFSGRDRNNFGTISVKRIK